MTADETVARGEDYYNQHFRFPVKPGHHGEYLVLDVDTGDYEIDADQIAAIDRAIAKRPIANRYIMRVGYRATLRIRGLLRRTMNTWLEAFLLTEKLLFS